MNLTEKAKKEIEELNAVIIAKEKETKVLEKRRQMERDSLYYKALNRELDSIWRKKNKAEETIKEIQKLGISTSENRNIKKEVSSFHNVKYDTSLGCRDVVAVGLSKTLNGYIKVEYTKFTSFMRNVKGCGSLANTMDFSSVEQITLVDYQTFIEVKNMK
jgi:hypothetical protein